MTKDSELGATMMQGHGGRSARYKVGDQVLRNNERLTVTAVTTTGIVRPLYELTRCDGNVVGWFTIEQKDTQ